MPASHNKISDPAQMRRSVQQNQFLVLGDYWGCPTHQRDQLKINTSHEKKPGHVSELPSYRLRSCDWFISSSLLPLIIILFLDANI